MLSTHGRLCTRSTGPGLADSSEVSGPTVEPESYQLRSGMPHMKF